MIVGVAFVPATPLLVPEVAQGAASELDDLRAACRTAIKRACAEAERVVIVGEGPQLHAYGSDCRGTLAGYGVPFEISLGRDGTGPPELPPALTVGAWLVHDALAADVPPICALSTDGASFGADRMPPVDKAALVVVGDGSARRSTAAPGYLDPRADPFDAAVADVLRTGDAHALRVDAELARHLLAAGAPAWAAAARLVTGSYDAQLLYDDAPCGVGYFVAAWTLRESTMRG